jgi:hypothetical protein
MSKLFNNAVESIVVGIEITGKTVDRGHFPQFAISIRARCFSPKKFSSERCRALILMKSLARSIPALSAMSS